MEECYCKQVRRDQNQQLMESKYQEHDLVNQNNPVMVISKMNGVSKQLHQFPQQILFSQSESLHFKNMMMKILQSKNRTKSKWEQKQRSKKPHIKLTITTKQTKQTKNKIWSFIKIQHKIHKYYFHMSSNLQPTNSFKKSAALLKGSELVMPIIQEKSFTSYFGRKNKGPEENSACLLACVINYLKTQEAKNLKKFVKYLDRCKTIITSEDKSDNVVMAECKYLNVALHNLILHAEILPFELKKDVYTMTMESLNLSPAAVAYFSANAKQISLYLISQFESIEMSFFTGNLLRIFLREELLENILDIQFIESIIQISRNTKYEISSEALETFHVIYETEINYLIIEMGRDFVVFKQKKPKQQETLSRFLLQNYQEVVKLFIQLAETENYLVKRDILQTLTIILSDPQNKQFMLKFINEKDNLKKILNILSSEEQRGFKEVALVLLEQFLQNYNSGISNDGVKNIIFRNKEQLIQCIKQCASECNKEIKGEQDKRTNQMIRILESI